MMKVEKTLSLSKRPLSSSLSADEIPLKNAGAMKVFLFSFK
jgi:hypothetical protein